MFGLGATELIFIFILALLIFGPKKLPQIGRTIGKGMAEFRRASTELQRAVNTEIEDPPPRRSAPPPRDEPAATVAEEAPTETALAPEASTTPSQLFRGHPSGDRSTPSALVEDSRTKVQ